LGITCWHWICLFGALREASNWLLVPAWVFSVLGLGALKPFMIAKEQVLAEINAYQMYGCDPDRNSGDRYTCTKLVEFVGGADVVLVEGLLITATSDRVGIFTGSESQIWMLTDNRKIIRRFSE